MRRAWSDCSGDSRNRSSSAGRINAEASASGGAGAVDAAHDGRGDARGLGHHEAAGGGDLVGERHDRRVQRPPEMVRAAAQVDRRREARRSRSPRSTSPVRQARPNVSVITTPTSSAQGRGRARPGARGRIRPGPPAAAPACPASTFDASTPAFAQTKPCAVSAITRSPRRATTRRVSALDRVRAIGAGHEPSLRLRHDLRRHDDDVAVRSSRRRSEGASRAARSSPGRTSGSPARARWTSTLMRAPASSATRASASAWSSSDHDRVRDGDPQPGGLDARRQVAVALVDHPARQQPVVRRGGAGRRDLEARRRHEAVGHAGDGRAAPRCRSRPPPRRRARRDRVADARHREDRPDRHDRVRRAEAATASAPAIAVEHARRGPRRLGALVAHALDVVGAVASHPVLLEVQVQLARPSSASTASIRVATRSSVMGSRRAVDPEALARSRAVTSVIVAPPREEVGPQQVRGEVEVAQVEPAPARRPSARSSSVARNVSPRRPQPRSRSNTSPSQ